MAKEGNSEQETGREKDVQSTTHVSPSTLHLHAIDNPSWSIIPLGVWYYLIAQTGLEGWFRGPSPELLTEQPKSQGCRTIGWLHNSQYRWLINQFICPSDGDRYPGCPVHPYSIDASQHTAVCFIRRLWLVCSEGLANSTWLITQDRSTRWRALGVCFRPPISLGNK